MVLGRYVVIDSPSPTSLQQTCVWFILTKQETLGAESEARPGNSWYWHDIQKILKITVIDLVGIFFFLAEYNALHYQCH